MASVCFSSAGILYLPTQFFPLSGAWTVIGQLGAVLAMLGTVTIIGYMGFAYTASKGIPFWSSPLHPALYIAYAFRGGIAVLLIVAATSGATAADDGLLKLWIGVTAIVAVFFALELQGAWAGGNVAARRSVREYLAGRVAVFFYGGISGCRVDRAGVAAFHGDGHFPRRHGVDRLGVGGWRLFYEAVHRQGRRLYAACAFAAPPTDLTRPLSLCAVVPRPGGLQRQARQARRGSVGRGFSSINNTMARAGIRHRGGRCRAAWGAKLAL